jgi:Holliday junction resolvasome RuvABC ATP-dependent DNA helicase subunit
MAGDVIGNVILTVYSYFPQLIQNKTLTEVFTSIVSNTTVLNFVAQASGFKNKTIKETLETYLMVVQYLNPTTGTSTNTTSSNDTSNG